MAQQTPISDQAVLNRIWSQTLLEELTRFGVEQICVAPGSRSTPLTLEAAENTKLTLHTHFDERGLGFLALGLAKASHKPVAIVVTSGTAVANLLPAIAEAKLTGEKLVVLTADRPVELVDCGANQAIVQSGIFSSHVTASLELPTPSTQVSLRWLLTSVDDVMYRQQQFGSTVHINCPFPEPLYSDQDKSIYQDYLAQISAWRESQKPYVNKVLPQASFASDIDLNWMARKGVLVVGSVELKQAKLAQQLAKYLGWPLLCDAQSGCTSEWAHFDIWLQDAKAKNDLSEAQVVVQLGSRIVSKRLNQWLCSAVEQGAEYHYVSPQLSRNNQAHLPQIHHQSDLETWLDTHIARSYDLVIDNAGWADSLKGQSQRVANIAKDVCAENVSLSELELALTLQQLPSKAQLFLGNSLFVRLVDMFAQIDGRAVYSNRGASGIDGLVATTAGVVRANQQPSVLYIGDTSLLYDVNSLALFTEQQTPVVIVVTNNDGGAIFDLLPVPKQQKQALYQMPHGYDFSHAAKQFKLGYQLVATRQEYQQQLEQHLLSGSGALLLEVQTPPEQASNQIKQVLNQLHARL
ncbi:2-succinyl-5-enolpyruvyl-6-hydroxy-3-cyclohexene-1-carboxylic-acid synthase [Vibrio intestinalis]|uniref:2-succinyl-5-enolpyruvyl-6-hydroxy-3- cyclohexene-1-carboxylic-acid synthase n=1 Tax=Vibrio intestinalis TaxID=2933291 RepID=UPI0021A65821|nr:2-succinyl-5-enolpyruvyl-6-hydroxy-3-cyclohexene-1-carboxylic-acid synthase [Vibrio intestinalis]